MVRRSATDVETENTRRDNVCLDLMAYVNGKNEGGE